MSGKGVKSTLIGVSKRIDTKPNKTEGIVNYDVDNRYPQRVSAIINASGTGTLCTDMLGKYLYGEGFVNEALAKTVVNRKGMNANKLLFKVRKSFSKYYGFAVHVNYNAMFEKTSFHPMPFEDLRLTTTKEEGNKKHPHMIALYDDWDKYKRTRIDHKKIEYFDFYDPDPAVIQAQVDAVGGWANYKGQIMYWTVEGPQYTLAPSDSILEDIQTDSHSKIFKNRNISTNFLASYIIETASFEDDEQRRDFINDLENFQGSDNAMKTMLLERMDGQDDLGMEFHKIDIQDVEKLYEFTENSARDNIIRNYQIPPVLLMAIPGKLGTSSEIIEGTASYNGTTREYRLAISAAFEELFTNYVKEVGDNFDIEEVQPSVVQPKDTVEGKAKIVEILTNSELTVEQKRIVLEDIYELSDEEALKLVPDGIQPKLDVQ